MLLTFDTEHEANDRYGNWLRKGHVGTIATMQLYFKDPRVAPTTPHCHIYHFLRGKMNTVPNGLARILDNADVLKIGHTIDKHDVPKVKTDLNCTVTPTRDTLKTAKMKRGVLGLPEKLGLDQCSKTLLNRSLPGKGTTQYRFNVHNALTAQQISYAAADVQAVYTWTRRLSPSRAWCRLQPLRLTS